MEGGKLIRLKDGDRLMTCEEVFNQFKKFLYRVTHHWASKYDFNDIFATASFGLVKAYKTYDISKDILFMTYLATIVNNEILYFNRREKKHLGTASLNIEVQNQKDNSETEMIDLIAEDKDYEEEIIRKLTYKEVSNILKSLNERDKYIIESYFFKDIKEPVIAKKLNVSQSCVSRLIKSIPLKLKKEYERGNNQLGNKEQRITREQLLAECKENGYDKNKIAEKYGCTPGTIDFYYYKWAIKKDLPENKDLGDTGEKKKEIFDFLTNNAEKSKDYLIGHAMTMFNATESTARTYYYKWKQEFMKPKVNVPNPLPENEIKAQRQEKKIAKKTAELKLNEPNPSLEKIKEVPQEVKEEIKEADSFAGIIINEPTKEDKPTEAEETGLKVSHKVVMMNIEGKGHNFYIEIQGLNNKTPYMKIIPNEHCKEYPEEISEAYKTFVKLLEL